MGLGPTVSSRAPGAAGAAGATLAEVPIDRNNTQPRNGGNARLRGNSDANAPAAGTAAGTQRANADATPTTPRGLFGGMTFRPNFSGPRVPSMPPRLQNAMNSIKDFGMRALNAFATGPNSNMQRIDLKNGNQSEYEEVYTETQFVDEENQNSASVSTGGDAATRHASITTAVTGSSDSLLVQGESTEDDMQYEDENVEYRRGVSEDFLDQLNNDTDDDDASVGNLSTTAVIIE